MINAIWSYNNGSQGARLLARALGIRFIKKIRSRFPWGRNQTVLNWGTGKIPDRSNSRIINSPDSVAIARNKLSTFRELRRLGRVRIPEFTTCPQEALGWLRTGSVCCRGTVTGHEGIGLSIVPRGSEALPRVPLYVKYICKASEWRVHIITGEAIHIQQKVRQRGAPEAGNTQIRNTANGYVFTSQRQAPGDVVEQSVSAIQDLGLDIGAVDVVWNEYYQQAYVLEVNTAPGIEGITVEKYAEALRRI